MFFHHGTIRKYTAALIDLFNDIEIQYTMSNGSTISKKIPLNYGSKEKSKILDKYTTEQILSGNYNVLPRASLSLVTMTKADQRIGNKNTKINNYKTDTAIEYSFNSVPYEFTFELTFQCRGMNEATQIIEQIAPQFTPTVNIDIWDVSNLDEATRIPVRLLDIGLESEEYDEISLNIFTVSCGISLMGNLYPPIKAQHRVQEFQIMLNETDGDYAIQREMLEWDVDLSGYIMPPGVLDTDLDGTEYNGGSGSGGEPGTNTFLNADQIGVLDSGGYYDGVNVEDVLQEIYDIFERVERKNQPGGYSGLDGNGLIPSGNLPRIFTTEKLEIVGDAATLPYEAVGDIITVHIYEDSSDVVSFYTFQKSGTNDSILFDPLDNLSGNYCKVTYIARII